MKNKPKNIDNTMKKQGQAMKIKRKPHTSRKKQANTIDKTKNKQAETIDKSGKTSRTIDKTMKKTSQSQGQNHETNKPTQ